MNLKKLPKIDLHLHLDGAIRVPTIAELLKQVRDHGTVFEICLTSNLQTCSVPSVQQHPFKRFFDEKVRVTLNTDDPAISDITLTDEFELTAREYRLTSAQIRELLVNAANAAFAEPSVRREIVGRLGASRAEC